MNSLHVLLVLPLVSAVAFAAKETVMAKHSTCLSVSEDPDRAKDFLVDINRLTMCEFARLTPEEIKAKHFTPADGTHTSVAGAELNARSVIKGLQQLKDCPLAGYLMPEAGR